jgi:hypothetical protein
METTRRDLLKGVVAIPIAGAIAAHLPPAAAATPVPSAPPVVKAPALPAPPINPEFPRLILSGDYPLYRFADGTVVNFCGTEMRPHVFPDGREGYYDTFFGCLRLLDATITDENGVKIAEAGWGMDHPRFA